MYSETVRLRSYEIPAAFFKKDTISHTVGDVSMHYHDEIELLRVFEGEFPCMVNGNRVVLHAGELLFINSRVPHATVPKLAKYEMIQISADRLLFSESPGSVTAGILLTGGVSYRKVCREEANELFSLYDKIFGEYLSGGAGSLSILLGSLYMIIGLLIQMKLMADPEDILKNRKLAKVAPAIIYMSEHYSEDITISDLAKGASMNISYFCELFKEATGRTCIEFLNMLRVRKAERLINSTDKSIIEIALEVGFASPSYFDRVFKKINGNSPSYYRRLRFGEAEAMRRV